MYRYDSILFIFLQTKLEAELQQIEEKHQAKKRKFTEGSEQFHDEYKKLCESKPQISDDAFQNMVAKAKEELKQKQQEMLAKQVKMAYFFHFSSPVLILLKMFPENHTGCFCGFH